MRMITILLDSSALRCATHLQTRDWLSNSASKLNVSLSTWRQLEWGQHLSISHRRKQNVRVLEQKNAMRFAGGNSGKGRKPPAVQVSLKLSRTSSPLWLTWELVIRPMLTSQVQKPLKRTLWKTTPKTSTYELKKVPLEPGASHLLFLAGTVLVKKSLNAEIVTNRFCWTINVMKVMMKMMRMSLETIVMILIGMRSTCATMKPWNVSAQCIPHSAHHNLRNQEIHGANIRT